MALKFALLGVRAPHAPAPGGRLAAFRRMNKHLLYIVKAGGGPGRGA